MVPLAVGWVLPSSPISQLVLHKQPQASMPTYTALLKLVDCVHAVLEESVSRVPLVADEASEDVGICPASAHHPGVYGDVVFYNCNSKGEQTPPFGQ